MANTPENVEALMQYAEGLSVEGATDLGGALTEAAAPRWLSKSNGQDGTPPEFVPAQRRRGHLGRERLVGPVEHRGHGRRGPLFAYNTGFAGTEGRLLAQLAAQSGGAVVLGRRQRPRSPRRPRPIARRPGGSPGSKSRAAATCCWPAARGSSSHSRSCCWSDGARPRPKHPEIVLTLSAERRRRRCSTRIGRVLPSQLAARTYGQVAVGQLEETAAPTEPMCRGLRTALPRARPDLLAVDARHRAGLRPLPHQRRGRWVCGQEHDRSARRWPRCWGRSARGWRDAEDSLPGVAGEAPEDGGRATSASRGVAVGDQGDAPLVVCGPGPAAGVQGPRAGGRCPATCARCWLRASSITT